ncbi:MAG TPA: hypothetical protein VK206_22110 [Anaerolineales bacterium]|nr:hypothetical protein [Anaerolineales bacterium]HLO33768.1 hypothetical protein [Anaerolineales bacterium]
MIRNCSFKVLSNLFLLMALSTGQVQAMPGKDQVFVPVRSPQSTEATTIHPAGSVSIPASSSTVSWNTFLGSSSWDQIHNILTDRDGNIIVAGTSGNNWGNPIIPHGGALNDYDVVVAKLDQNGTLIWNTFLGGVSNEIDDAILDENGDVYITGRSNAEWGDPINPHHGGSQQDMFIAKIDRDGTLLWNTFLGNDIRSDDYPMKIVTAPSGEIYIAGPAASSYYGGGCFYWGTPISYEGCIFIAKLDTSGNLLWNTFLGGEGRWDVFSAFTIDSLGSIYVAASAGYDCDIYSCTFKEFVTKLDSDGNRLWTTFPNGDVYDEVGVSDILVDPAGNVYLSGSSHWGWGSPVNPHTGGWDSLIAKIDPSGNLLWHTFLGGPGIDSASHIILDENGNIYIDGRSETNWGNPITPFQGANNSFVAKLDANGNLLWNTFPGGIGDDLISDLVLDDYGEISITGHSSDTWGSPTNSFGENTQSFVADLNSDGVLQWNTFIGSDSVSLALDGNANLFVGGHGWGTWGEPVNPYAGNSDLFIVKFGPVPLPVVSPDLSTVTISPASVLADGIAQATVTVTLIGTDHNPVANKKVILISDRGGNDIVVQPITATDENGQASGAISSIFTGTSQIHVVDVTDNVRLSQQPLIRFADNNPALRQRINILNTLSINSLNRVAAYAQSAGEQGDYFRGAIAEDAVNTTLNALGLFTGTREGVKEIKNLRGGVQLALPGLEDAGYGVIDGFLSKYPASRDLFNFTVRKALQSGDYTVLTQPVLNAGFRYYAVKYLQSRAQDISQDAIINAWQHINSSEGGFTEAGNWLGSDINNLKSGLADLSSLSTPPLSAGQQAAYIEDLRKRSMVPVILADITRQQTFLLENVRDAHESNAWSGNFTLKFLADALATTSFDGPGHILVNGLTDGFDLYLNARKFNSDMLAFAQVPGILKGSVESATSIYENEATGLDRIHRILPARTVTGQITAVRNYSQGQSSGLFYVEDRSFSEIDIQNTSASEATFEVIAQYGYNTHIFRVPWAYMPLVKSEVVALAPGESKTIRIYYKKDGSGGSPDKNDSIVFNVLAANSTGIFFAGNKLVYWNPQILSNVGSWSTESPGSLSDSNVAASSDVVLVENPIATYVTSSSIDQKYRAEIYVANPFNRSIDASITQNLPAGITILTTDGTATSDGSAISWQKNIASGNIELFEFTFRYAADPDDSLNLPAAKMSFVEPTSGQAVDILSNVPTFTALSPITLEGYAPISISQVETEMSITVTNQADTSNYGTIDITLSDSTGQTFTDVEQFNVNGFGQQVVTFTLPGLPEGLYPVEVFVTIGGVTIRAFGDTYRVLPPPAVASVTRASANPSNEPDVDFTVTFTEPVTGVDMDDFSLTITGDISGSSVSTVSGSDAIYTIKVNTGTGTGAIRLDVVDDDSIKGAADHPLGGPGAGNGEFSTGEIYTMAANLSRPTFVWPPKNNYTTINSTPTLTWSDSPEATRYEILFATDTAFTRNVNSYFVTDPTFTFSNALTDCTYYLRVREYDVRDQPGLWSVPRSFTIDTQAPLPPALRSPANGSNARGVPIFRWSAAAGAVQYQFEIDNDADFSSPVLSITQRAIYRRPPGMLRSTYFWRVRAQDAAGNWSAWSDIFAVNILPLR